MREWVLDGDGPVMCVSDPQLDVSLPPLCSLQLVTTSKSVSSGTNDLWKSFEYFTHQLVREKQESDGFQNIRASVKYVRLVASVRRGPLSSGSAGSCRSQKRAQIPCMS